MDYAWVSHGPLPWTTHGFPTDHYHGLRMGSPRTITMDYAWVPHGPLPWTTHGFPTDHYHGLRMGSPRTITMDYAWVSHGPLPWTTHGFPTDHYHGLRMGSPRTITMDYAWVPHGPSPWTTHGFPTDHYHGLRMGSARTITMDYAWVPHGLLPWTIAMDYVYVFSTDYYRESTVDMVDYACVPHGYGLRMCLNGPLPRTKYTFRGALPKNTWRVCAATLIPIFKPPVTEWPLFMIHSLLSPNDHHFQNVVSLNDPILRNKMTNNAHTEWPPFSPINNHILIYYPIFVWKEGFIRLLNRNLYEQILH